MIKFLKLVLLIGVLFPDNSSVSEQLSQQKININTVSISELQESSLSFNQADSVYNYIIKRGPIESIYVLANLESIGSKEIHILKNNFFIGIKDESAFEKNRKKSNYKTERWLSAEGNSEGLSELWLDTYYEPKDVNLMNYDDLMSLPNLSPVDAIAVLKQQRRGSISGSFQLKNSPGISYWGYKNLIDFVDFKSSESSKFHIRYSGLARTIPITTNPDNDGTISELSNTNNPELYSKISVFNSKIKSGVVYHRNMGESNDVAIKKITASLEGVQIYENIRLDRLVAGYFTASFGQGLVFESNDYFSPRRTGYGFSKRAVGIRPDLGRSSQYVMRGIGLQLSNSFFRGSFFISKHPRDAIVNSDDSFSSLITMQPRLSYGINPDKGLKLTSSVNELTWGANIRLSPIIGAFVGFTFYESLYDRTIDPQILESITGGPDIDYSGDEYFGTYLTNSADPEIMAMYANTDTIASPIWSDAVSYRRLIGLDFSSTISNIVFQGEYGRFLLNDNTAAPDAIVLSAYAQFNNISILALYRNYDLEFDNPYQRSFSNYQRYKTSIFEDTYWLDDPIYGYLYSGTPQPQSEEGFYIFSRFQVHRSVVGYLHFDTWSRKADLAKYFRSVLTLDIRPAFNFRINLRNKWQARASNDFQHASPYYSRESRVRFRLRMSSFNQMELLFSNSYTQFSPRPRLTDSPYGADMNVGSVGSPDLALGCSLIHNASDNFKIKVGTLFINGFLWYFEDTDFRIFSEEFGAMHNWISFRFNPNPNLSLSLKATHTSGAQYTTIDDAQLDSGAWINNPIVTSNGINYRVQIDYGI